MKIRKLLLAVYTILLFLLANSCRKLEVSTSKSVSDPNQSIETFLRIPKDADPILIRLIEDLKRKEAAHPFINNLIKQAGMPRWDHSEVSYPSISRSEIHVNNLSPNSSSSNTQNTTDTTILVPLVYDRAKSVNSFVAFHMSGTVKLDLIRGKDYKKYGYDESTNKPNAKRIAMRCMLFDHEIFKTDTFKISDKSLALAFSGGKDTSGLFIYSDNSTRATSQRYQPNLYVYITTCQGGNWVIDYTDMGNWDTYTQEHPPTIYVGGTCSTEWISLSDGYDPDNYYIPEFFLDNGTGGSGDLGWSPYDASYINRRLDIFMSSFTNAGNSLSQAETEWVTNHPYESINLSNWMTILQSDASVDQSAYNFIAAKIAIDEQINGIENGPYDAYYEQNILTPNLPLPSMIPIGTYAAKWAAAYSVNCVMLKAQHPDWGSFHVRFEAARVTLQLGLDVIGLVPAVGTVANLLNATIYAISGEGTNATLSMVAAIPIAGWVSTGAKFAIKGENMMFKATNNVIKFTRDQNAFRKALGLAKTDGLIAHHIIPFAKADHYLVQKAAEEGFHINEVLNGIAVTSLQQAGSHPQYDARVVQKMEDIITSYGGISNISPAQAYTEISNLINQIKVAISGNPTVAINNLIF